MIIITTKKKLDKLQDDLKSAEFFSDLYHGWHKHRLQEYNRTVFELYETQKELNETLSRLGKVHSLVQEAKVAIEASEQAAFERGRRQERERIKGLIDERIRQLALVDNMPDMSKITKGVAQSFITNLEALKAELEASHDR